MYVEQYKILQDGIFSVLFSICLNMTILYETIRKILHFLASTIWYLMVPSILLLELWPCWLDGEVATLQSPLIMAGPPDWSDCGPLATWAGNEWVVLSTLCFNIQRHNSICAGDKGLVVLLHAVHASVKGWCYYVKYLILKSYVHNSIWQIITAWSSTAHNSYICQEMA